MVAALYYADRASDAASILNSLIASECALPNPSDPDDKGWTHSLDTVSDSCGYHFGANYGIHVGASAWVYFAVESSAATEIYISAVPGENAPPQDQAQEIFSGIRDVLRSKRASILQERVFATQAVMKDICRVRSRVYGDLDAGVAPSLLVGKEGTVGPIAGVQVHAVSSDGKPEAIGLEGNLCGRILRMPGRAYLALSGISDQQGRQAAELAKAMMEKV